MYWPLRFPLKNKRPFRITERHPSTTHQLQKLGRYPLALSKSGNCSGTICCPGLVTLGLGLPVIARISSISWVASTRCRRFQYSMRGLKYSTHSCATLQEYVCKSKHHVELCWETCTHTSNLTTLPVFINSSNDRRIFSISLSVCCARASSPPSSSPSACLTVLRDDEQKSSLSRGSWEVSIGRKTR